MKKFKIEIPEGYEAKIENGGVVCYPIDKGNCNFEVGDIVVCRSGCGNYDIIRLIHRVSKKGAKLKYWASHEIVTDYSLHELRSGGDGIIVVSAHAKATPEQERLFKRQCLENGVWFDKETKKWIELKDSICTLKTMRCGKWIFVFNKFEEECIFSKTSFSGNHVYFDDRTCQDYAILNISEATEEEKQHLFDALAKKGKQWNVGKNCVEDLKWKPKIGDYYWLIGERFCPYQDENNDTNQDHDAINIGNCFKTQEECEKYAEYMKQCSLNYKP